MFLDRFADFGTICYFGGKFPWDIFLPHKRRVNLINLYLIDIFLNFLYHPIELIFFCSPDRRRRRPGNVLMILTSQGSRLALEHTHRSYSFKSTLWISDITASCEHFVLQKSVLSCLDFN